MDFAGMFYGVDIDMLLTYDLTKWTKRICAVCQVTCLHFLNGTSAVCSVVFKKEFCRNSNMKPSFCIIKKVINQYKLPFFHHEQLQLDS